MMKMLLADIKVGVKGTMKNETKRRERKMIYKNFKEEKLSLLGFGTMRLPLNAEGKIDEPQVEEMVKFAMDHGVNYFDTAWPYHSGLSESLIGRILKKYDRTFYNFHFKPA